MSKRPRVSDPPDAAPLPDPVPDDKLARVLRDFAKADGVKQFGTFDQLSDMAKERWRQRAKLFRQVAKKAGVEIG